MQAPRLFAAAVAVVFFTTMSVEAQELRSQPDSVASAASSQRPVESWVDFTVVFESPRESASR